MIFGGFGCFSVFVWLGFGFLVTWVVETWEVLQVFGRKLF